VAEVDHLDVDLSDTKGRHIAMLVLKVARSESPIDGRRASAKATQELLSGAPRPQHERAGALASWSPCRGLGRPFLRWPKVPFRVPVRGRAAGSR
jgi:hypothetical protein